MLFLTLNLKSVILLHQEWKAPNFPRLQFSSVFNPRVPCWFVPLYLMSLRYSHGEKWLSSLFVGTYSCSVWRKLWEAVPTSAAVLWQVSKKPFISLEWKGRRTSWDSRLFFLLLFISIMVIIAFCVVDAFSFCSDPPIPIKAYFSRWHQALLSQSYPFTQEGVKYSVSPVFWMSHHLWEKWAAEQTENNLLKEKIQASGQGKGGCWSSKCRKWCSCWNASQKYVVIAIYIRMEHATIVLCVKCDPTLNQVLLLCAVTFRWLS